MRKINTRGIESVNKVMLMAAMAYNLKKLLKHTPVQTEAMSKGLIWHVVLFLNLIYLFLGPIKAMEIISVKF